MPAAHPERVAARAGPGASVVLRRRAWAVAAGSAARVDGSPGAAAGVAEGEVAAADSAAPAALAGAAGAAGAGATAGASSNRAGQTRDGRSNSGPNSRRH
jgi:hypothetical protein